MSGSHFHDHLWPSPMHRRALRWRAELARYFGLVMGSPCTPVVSASATKVDATLHRLPIETPIPMLWKAAFIGCAIVFAALAWLPANAMNANIPRRARGTPDRVPLVPRR